jgi:hypothetical protein
VRPSLSVSHFPSTAICVRHPPPLAGPPRRSPEQQTARPCWLFTRPTPACCSPTPHARLLLGRPTAAVCSDAPPLSAARPPRLPSSPARPPGSASRRGTRGSRCRSSARPARLRQSPPPVLSCSPGLGGNRTRSDPERRTQCRCPNAVASPFRRFR